MHTLSYSYASNYRLSLSDNLYLERHHSVRNQRSRPVTKHTYSIMFCLFYFQSMLATATRIPGYIVIRKRSENVRGGGLC